MEAHIAALRAELLHKEQENERVQLQLAKEKEERERAERQVILTNTGVSAPTASYYNCRAPLSYLHCMASLIVKH